VERAQRARPVREVALAFLAGGAGFWLAAAALSAIDSGVVAALLGLAYVAAVVAIARVWGVAYAVPVGMAGMLSYDWFYLPPTHTFEVPDTANLLDLLIFLGVGVLLGQLAANAVRRARRSERARAAIAAEQAALRRVATLVARGVPPDQVFAAVAREVAEVLGVHATHMARYDASGMATGVGSWSPGGTHMRVGSRAALDDTSVMGMVLKTGRPARKDDYADASGEVAAMTRALNVRSSVGTPILVEDQLWGAIVASSDREEPLPENTESRLLEFTELVATAIANTEARTELDRLADEQAALRRVATLVAHGSPAADVFEAVAEELGLLLNIEDTALLRYEADGMATIVVNRVQGAVLTPVGTRVKMEGTNVAPLVLQMGFRSGVGTPIVVEGRLWGVMVAVARHAESLPAGVEARMEEFTELIGTAVSNIQARSDLAASRARIVEAADDERRRVVRDLHDGAQQRLVHTILTLKLAQRAVEQDGGKLPASLVTEAIAEAELATAELRELAHGILPSVLTRGGLSAGLKALAVRTTLPVEISVDAERLPAPVEATAYFVVAEALTNVMKHSRATRAKVEVEVEDGSLRIRVRDDGVGGARSDGSGVVGLADRVAVLNGRFQIESPGDGGTLVEACIPVSDQLAKLRR
jgi:signal transduction histidine kinase